MGLRSFSVGGEPIRNLPAGTGASFIPSELVRTGSGRAGPVATALAAPRTEQEPGKRYEAKQSKGGSSEEPRPAPPGPELNRHAIAASQRGGGYLSIGRFDDLVPRRRLPDHGRRLNLPVVAHELQGPGHLGRRLIAVLHSLRHHSPQHRNQAGREIGSPPLDRLRLALAVSEQFFHRRAARKRRLPGKRKYSVQPSP